MSGETIDGDLRDELVEAVVKRLEDGDIPDEALPDGDLHIPTVKPWVRERLRASGDAASFDEIMKAAEGDELLQRRLQSDAGIRQWIMEALPKMVGIELERRIQSGEFVRENREDGSTHVRRA